MFIQRVPPFCQFGIRHWEYRKWEDRCVNRVMRPHWAKLVHHRHLGGVLHLV